MEREEDVSFLPPESLTFDIRVDTDPRQVCVYLLIKYYINNFILVALILIFKYFTIVA